MAGAPEQVSDVVPEHHVLACLVRWAEETPAARVVLLEGSRAALSCSAVVDRFSDYDAQVFVTDIQTFREDETWLTSAYGPPMVAFRDQHGSLGFTSVTRLVLYHDGTKIDFMLWPIERLQALSAAERLPPDLDVGYRILVDKDAATGSLPAPTDTALRPKKPTEQEFRALVEEFWWETTYVAKNLWREALFPAKYNLEAVIRFELLERMLTWYVGATHDWSSRVGTHGRWLPALLPRALWQQLESTFVGDDADHNWSALFQCTSVFRTIALAVADHLSYAYPHEMDRHVSAYLAYVRSLPK